MLLIPDPPPPPPTREEAEGLVVPDAPWFPLEQPLPEGANVTQTYHEEFPWLRGERRNPPRYPHQEYVPQRPASTPPVAEGRTLDDYDEIPECFNYPECGFSVHSDRLDSRTVVFDGLDELAINYRSYDGQVTDGLDRDGLPIPWNLPRRAQSLPPHNELGRIPRQDLRAPHMGWCSVRYRRPENDVNPRRGDRQGWVTSEDDPERAMIAQQQYEARVGPRRPIRTSVPRWAHRERVTRLMDWIEEARAANCDPMYPPAPSPSLSFLDEPLQTHEEPPMEYSYDATYYAGQQAQAIQSGEISPPPAQDAEAGKPAKRPRSPHFHELDNDTPPPKRKQAHTPFPRPQLMPMLPLRAPSVRETPVAQAPGPDVQPSGVAKSAKAPLLVLNQWSPSQGTTCTPAVRTQPNHTPSPSTRRTKGNGRLPAKLNENLPRSLFGAGVAASRGRTIGAQTGSPSTMKRNVIPHPDLFGDNYRREVSLTTAPAQTRGSRPEHHMGAEHPPPPANKSSARAKPAPATTAAAAPQTTATAREGRSSTLAWPQAPPGMSAKAQAAPKLPPTAVDKGKGVAGRNVVPLPKTGTAFDGTGGPPHPAPAHAPPEIRKQLPQAHAFKFNLKPIPADDVEHEDHPTPTPAPRGAGTSLQAGAPARAPQAPRMVAPANEETAMEVDQPPAHVKPKLRAALKYLPPTVMRNEAGELVPVENPTFPGTASARSAQNEQGEDAPERLPLPDPNRPHVLRREGAKLEFTAPPPGGFPTRHRADARAPVINLEAKKYVACLEAPEETSLFLDIPQLSVPDPASAVHWVARIKEALKGVLGEDSEIPTVVPPSMDPRIVFPDDYDLKDFVPTAWFVPVIAKKDRDFLMMIECVSTELITMFVYALDMQVPLYVGTAKGFTDRNKVNIRNGIRQVFEAGEVREILDEIATAASDQAEPGSPFDASPEEIVARTIESIEIKDVDIPNRDLIVVNAYCHPATADPADGRRVCMALLNARVEVHNSQAGYFRTPIVCDICYGADHNPNQCGYPSIKGWKGPIPNNHISRHQPPPADSLGPAPPAPAWGLPPPPHPPTMQPLGPPVRGWGAPRGGGARGAHQTYPRHEHPQPGPSSRAVVTARPPDRIPYQDAARGARQPGRGGRGRGRGRNARGGNGNAGGPQGFRYDSYDYNDYGYEHAGDHRRQY